VGIFGAQVRREEILMRKSGVTLGMGAAGGLRLSAAKGATAAQVALAWLLARGPSIVPIFGRPVATSQANRWQLEGKI